MARTGDLKSRGSLLATPALKFQFIAEHHALFSVLGGIEDASQIFLCAGDVWRAGRLVQWLLRLACGL
jgi:hypothetical protein